MATMKELKQHMESVADTEKITGAMYLIASAKLRKAKAELDATRPYFDALSAEIKRIFRINETMENRYFYPPSGERDLPGAYGYLVITADKGLAGAYNQNVIREAEKQLAERSDTKLFVVGEYGRHYFRSQGVKIARSFLYTAQNPTIWRAREIADVLLGEFDEGKLSKIFIIYTDLKSAMHEQVITTRLLPFHRADSLSPAREKAVVTPFEFVPSMDEVLSGIVPGYLTGFIYSALIDSFTSEQEARMTAMDAAKRNAERLIDDLRVRYQHVRQSAITREITEIASGARALEERT